MPIDIEQTQLYYNYDKAFVDKIYKTVSIRAQDDSGNIVSRPVPCVFDVPERAFASIARQIARRKGVNDIRDEDVKNIPLPIISVSRGDDVLDPKRYIMVKLTRLMYSASTGSYLGTYLPQPTDLTYQVDVWGRNIKDVESIKNQILLWLRFNEFYLHVNHPDPFGERIVLTEFKGMQDTSKKESATEQRILRKTLNFVVHGWLCPNAISADIIRKAVVDIKDKNTNELYTQVVVTGDYQEPDAPVIPQEEPAPTMKTTVYAVLIPGITEVGALYGNYTCPSKMSILGMQAAITGRAPTGANLVFVLRKNGSDVASRYITVREGEIRASVVFGTALPVVTGDVLQLHCTSTGTTQPAEWVEVQYNVEIQTT